MSSTPKISVLKTSNPEELSLTGILEQIRIKSTKVRSTLTGDLDGFGKVGADTSYPQSQMHSDYDSVESIADSDLEGGELWENVGFTTVFAESRRLWILSNANRNRWNLLQCHRREERVQKSAHADLWKGLMSSSSQEPSAPVNPFALFSIGSEEPGDQFKSSVFRNADPPNVVRSLLEGNQDHLLSRGKSELVRQEHQVGSLNNCISVQQRAYAQRLEVQDAQHGYVESRLEHFRLQEELSMKEKVLPDTLIRSMHEMGEMTRAQELRVDKVSEQKLRENHETIQKLTSQLQEMQDQMNSMGDSGEFQEVESNYSVRFSYVSSQPAMIPSSRSMLSRDKRLPLDTWNTSGLQENVFVINFLRLIHTEIIIKEFTVVQRQERQDQSNRLHGRRHLS